MTRVYLGLGSNMGDRKTYLLEAIHYIGQMRGTQLIQVSSFYETKAWGNTDQADFLNAVCSIETLLSPEDLLLACQKIEKDLDRIRKEHWGPRTIDIDILLYGQENIKNETLTIPHAYLFKRAFVLVPLLEIASNMTETDVKQLVDSLAKLDTSEVTIFSKFENLLTDK